MSKYGSSIKEHVRDLRLEGLSLGQIQKQTNIPKTTVQLWTRNIIQSDEQRQLIKEHMLIGLQEGRIRSQEIQGRERMEREATLFRQGKGEIAQLTLREVFIAGVALYWAEGFKNIHEHRLGFCNSDPNMIKFYLHWLENVLGVKKQDIVLRLAVNFSYKEKTDKILQYWVLQTGLPVSQFTKTFYQKAQWKREYTNSNYYGVLRVHVKDSLNYLLKMRGWINGLSEILPR